MKVAKFLSVFILVSLAFLYVNSSILAEDGGKGPGSSGVSERNAMSDRPISSPKAESLEFRLFGTGSGEPKRSPEPGETPRVRGEDRLNEARLKVCTIHEEEITKRSDSLMALVSNMLGKFDSIAAKVEEFYTTKVLPSGKSVPNYDALVADIATQKEAVATALKNAQTDVAGFSCTGTNPKGQITQYRKDMQAVKTALESYRKAIKNLIVAVRGVVGETEGSPKPSATPLATPVSTATPVATATP